MKKDIVSLAAFLLMNSSFVKAIDSMQLFDELKQLEEINDPLIHQKILTQYKPTFSGSGKGGDFKENTDFNESNLASLAQYKDKTDTDHLVSMQYAEFVQNGQRRDCVQVFDNVNFQGGWFQGCHGGGGPQFYDLGQYNMWKKTSSFIIGADTCVEFLSYINVKRAREFWTICGPYKIDWVGDQMNDLLGYLTVSVYNEAQDPKVQLFGACDFLPSYANAVGPGDYYANDLLNWGMYYGDDRLSSLRVPKGLAVTLCRVDQLTGCEQPILGPKEVKNLGEALNDNIYSLRVQKYEEVPQKQIGPYLLSGQWIAVLQTGNAQATYTIEVSQSMTESQETSQLIEEGFDQQFSVTVGVEAEMGAVTANTEATYGVSSTYRKSVGKTFAKSFTETTTTTTTVQCNLQGTEGRSVTIWQWKMDGQREAITPSYEQLGTVYPAQKSKLNVARASTMYAFCKLGSVPPKCIPLLCEDASCDVCPPGALVH